MTPAHHGLCTRNLEISNDVTRSDQWLIRTRCMCEMDPAALGEARNGGGDCDSGGAPSRRLQQQLTGGGWLGRFALMRSQFCYYVFRPA